MNYFFSTLAHFNDDQSNCGMRILFWLCVITLPSTYVFSQQPASPNGIGKITGRVLDSLSKKPVEYSTITVFLNGNAKPVGGTIANDKGGFEIDSLAPGNYTMTISFIGYTTATKKNIIISTPDKKISLGNVLISSNLQNLSPVTVNTAQGLIENKIDRLVYNAEKDITSQGGVATDVLRKVPFLSVDVNGNVELNGSTGVRILINGKPSAIFGNKVSDALRSIPASQISYVEVISSPGAKYDAEGVAGIVNIVLKQNKIQGMNGNVNLSAGSQLELGAFNLNARKGSFGVNAAVNGNMILSSSTVNTLDRTSFDTYGNQKKLLQNGTGSYDRTGYSLQTGFDWDISKKDNLSGAIGYNTFTYSDMGLTNQESKSAYGATISDTLSLRNSMNKVIFSSVDWNIDYRKTFQKPGQELYISVQSGNGNNNVDYDQEQKYTSGSVPFSGSKSDNTWRNTETIFKIDYSQPFDKTTSLEFGAKTLLTRINSNSNYYGLKSLTQSYVFDPSQLNNIIYNKNIYALYASLTARLFNFFDIKAGVRYERTDASANFSSMDVTSLPGYNTFAPSGVISRSYKKNQTIKLSYSRRILRPGYQSLNPFVNASDPTNITTGNPYLKPEMIHYFELAYNRSYKKGYSLFVSLYYRYSTDDIQPYLNYYPSLTIGDSVYRNVAVTTTKNVGTQQVAGVNMLGVLPFSPKLSMRVNVVVAGKYIESTLVPGNTASSFNYKFNINTTYRLSDDVVFEFFGDFNSPRHEIQGITPSFTSYSFACQNASLVKKVFVVHGEEKVQLDFQQRLLQNGFANVEVPHLHEEFDLG